LRMIDKRPLALVDRQNRALTTRAFTASEMLRLFSSSERRRGRQHTGLVESFGQLPDRDNWKHFPDNRNAVAMLHWEASWLVPASTEVAFGADQTHTAWTILVNGRVAASWQDGEPRPGGGAFGPKLQLKPGIHTIQMIVVQKPEEQLPNCLVRTASGNPAGDTLSGLLPAFRPEWLGAESNGKAENSLHTVITPDTTYRFRATDNAINVFTVALDADGASRSYLDHRGRELAVTADGLLLCPAGQTPTAVISKGSTRLTFPGRRHWQAGTLVNGRIRLDDLPTVLPHAEPLPLNLHLEWQEMLPEAIQQALLVTVTQTDRKGTRLATSTATVTSNGAIPSLTIPLDDACRQVTVTCGLLDYLALAPLTLAVLRPGDSLAGLNAIGVNVFQHGNRAIFVCNPLPPSPLASHKPAAPSASPSLRIALLDDFMATATAPGAELLPETVMETALQQETPALQITRVLAVNPPGATSRLAPWEALAAAHDLRPEMIILAIGALPLADDMEPREWSSHLLFAAQSSLAVNIVPVLVALPALPTINPASSRLAALYTKEIGLALGLPVLDLHSRRLADTDSLTSWFQPGAPAPATPNDQARHWLAATAAKAFQQSFRLD
ncbi:MAG TPA: hypothetical protein PKY10_10785, partial [Lentisphaeria bacterium]|nr:hypothetical protein [Lentisphaeria bacterium]